MDLDAADDAVGARRGGELDAVALAGEALGDMGQVDGIDMGRHGDRLQRRRRRRLEDERQHGEKPADDGAEPAQA